jgi:sugar lactone lactonase YvrE
MKKTTSAIVLAAAAILAAVAISPLPLRADGASVMQTSGSLSALGGTYTGSCNSVQTPSDNIYEACNLKLTSGTPVSKTKTFSYSSTDGFGRPVQCLAVLTPSGNAEAQCRKSNTAIVFVASIRLSLSQSTTTVCLSNVVSVNVDALDSGGNVISGPYLDASGNPLTITLSLTDASHSTSLSATSLMFPTPITLTYNGQPASSATVSASAPGLTTQMATLTIASSHSLYVADRRFFVQLNDAVAVFANGANGNVAPLRLPNSPRSQLANPYGIAIDGSCNMYVSDNANGTNIATGVSVYPVSANGTTSPTRTFTDSTNTLPVPWGLALDPSGNVTVAYQNTGFAGSFDEIAFFAPNSSGAVVPLFQLTGDSTGLSFPASLGFDPSGRLYVGNLRSNTVTGYAAGAHGNTPPIHALTGDVSHAINFPEAVAVDSSGNIYVANAASLIDFGPDTVTVYGPGADGYPTPIRTLSGAATGITAPQGLAVDSAGNLYVLNGFIGTTSITVFAPGANGNVAPIRTLTGPKAGALGSAIPGSPMALDASGNLYIMALGSTVCGRCVMVFAAGASGTDAPIRTITDSTNSTFNGNLSSSIAVDAIGTVYVGSNNRLAQNNKPDLVMVFAPGASGDAAPTKTITSTAINGDVQALGLDSSGNVYLEITTLGGGVDSVQVFGPTASGNSTPIRSMLGYATDEYDFASMAVDSAGNVIQTGYNNTGGQANSISVYSTSVSGTATPSRVIRGGALGVFSPLGLGFDSAGNLYVLNLSDQTVKVYAPGADGLATPIRTIQGVPFEIHGLMVEADGTVYVAATTPFTDTTDPNAGMIFVYAPGANGLAAPIRTIKGSNTHLNYPVGMTIGP